MLSEPVREIILRTAQASGDIATAAMDTVCDALRVVVGTNAVAEAAGAAMRAAALGGFDPALAARGAVLGVVRGTDSLDPIPVAVRAVIGAADDPPAAAKGAVQGAIRGAMERGEDTLHAALEAGRAALEATQGSEAVRAALADPIDGLRILH